MDRALGASKVGLTLLNPAINALCPGGIAFGSRNCDLKPSQYMVLKQVFLTIVHDSHWKALGSYP